MSYLWHTGAIIIVGDAMNRLRMFVMGILLISYGALQAMQSSDARPLCLMLDGENKDEQARAMTCAQVALARPDLRVLAFKNMQLVSLPEGIAGFKKLRSLDLEGNALTDKAAEVIGSLTQLRSLNINGNQFKTLPKAITCLKHLRELRAAKNFIARVCGGWHNLKHLRSLDLMCNDLPEIDPSIGKLNELDELFLDANLLRDLPASMAHLPSLEILGLTHNYFKSLPGVAKRLGGGGVVIDPSDEMRRAIDCADSGSVVVYYDQRTQHRFTIPRNALLRE